MPDRILVADDELNIRNLARMILEGEGFQVTEAADGDEAIQKADEVVPDLILLDVVMPGKSGLEACKLLKSRSKTRHITVVMFTALGRDVDRKLAADSLADGYFLKPFTPADLVGVVKEHLEHVRSEKFARQLGLAHNKVKGKKILLEFDPSNPYERLARDFALEGIGQNDDVVVITRRGSAVRQSIEGENKVQLVDAASNLMLSSVLSDHPDKPLSILYDSLTDLALSSEVQVAYKFAQDALVLLDKPTVTVLFLLNPSAHDVKDVSSIKGLFSSHAAYGREGVAGVRIV